MYIALDIEAGGIGHDKSLLTAYFEILDKDFNTLDSLSVKVRPKDKIYKVTAEALSINNINLIEHEAEAETVDYWGTQLYDFLKRNSKEGADKLIPVGHNVAFDVKFVTESPDKLMSKGTWNTFVSYRPIDTCSLAQALRVVGKLPFELSCSLTQLAEFFGISTEGAHTADADVKMTVEVAKKLLKIVTN